jgi:hypothetical protein
MLLLLLLLLLTFAVLGLLPLLMLGLPWVLPTLTAASGPAAAATPAACTAVLSCGEPVTPASLAAATHLLKTLALLQQLLLLLVLLPRLLCVHGALPFALLLKTPCAATLCSAAAAADLLMPHVSGTLRLLCSCLAAAVAAALA